MEPQGEKEREVISLVQSNTQEKYGAIQKREKGCVISLCLTYTVQVKTGGFAWFSEYKTKTILREVSAVFKPGMNAILGPTGSGKTSLLNILAGRRKTGTVAGMVLLDGLPLPAHFKCMSGYVLQDDVVMGTLTVRENLNFSAALRLPQTTTKYERQTRVNAVLSDLGLTHVADSMVGTVFARGVSGGERRRTSIGMELIVSPSVLFLDEPTTGLDAFTAASVMQLVYQLARRGKTVIFAIHQPRYSIFRLFDTITLLAKGQVVYHGSSATVLSYFEQLGYVSGQHDNPADFFLDIVQSSIEKLDANSSLTLATRYESSKHAELIQKELDAIHNGHHISQDGFEKMDLQKIDYPTSRVHQFFIISKRSLQNIIRTPTLSFIKVANHFLAGLALGSVYYHMSDNPEHAIQNRVGAIFSMVVIIIFSNVIGLKVFIEQRSLFIRESVSGYYRVLPYFLAKVACDVIAVKVIPTIIFSIIVYYMIGVHSSFVDLLFFMTVLVLSSLAGSSISFFFSSLFSVQAVASVCLALTLAVMVMFTGFFVNLSSVSVFFRWIKYVSIFRFAIEALELSFLEGKVFCPSHVKINNTCPDPADHRHVISGNHYLQQQGFHLPGQKWHDVLTLASFVVGLLLLTYLRLFFMRKTL